MQFILIAAAAIILPVLVTSIAADIHQGLTDPWTRAEKIVWACIALLLVTIYFPR